MGYIRCRKQDYAGFCLSFGVLDNLSILNDIFKTFIKKGKPPKINDIVKKFNNKHLMDKVLGLYAETPETSANEERYCERFLKIVILGLLVIPRSTFNI